MPRGDRFGLPITQVHIADGFSSDCDEMVHRCLQFQTLNFQEFTKIWKEMNFDLLYEGRSSGAELAELSEELIHIAKHYMVKDTSYFEESVTGLFLVYSLLNLQPFSGFACLRLVPSDVRAVNRIETVARRERRLDVLFVLGEVLVKWTQYHADERPRGMEVVLRKYLEGYTSIDKLGVRPMGVFYRQNEELDHIRDLGSMTRQYVLAKAALFDDSTNVPSLQYINKNLANELTMSLRKLISGVVEDVDEQDPDNDSSSEEENKMSEKRSKSLQAIKAKAMSNAVGPMNHLTSGDNKKKTKTSPKNTSDLKKPTGRIKTGSHTRPVTTSPKKPKGEVKPRRRPKSKGDLSKDPLDDDLNIEEFNQISDSDDDSDDDEESNYASAEQDNLDCQNEQQGDIEIESLPLILRAGDMGPDIEIEIIDHTKSTTNKTVHNSKTPNNQIEIEIIDHTQSKTKRTEPKNTRSSKSTKTSNSDNTEIDTIDLTRKNKGNKTKSPKITNTSKASSSKCEDKTKSPKITNTSKASSSKCEDKTKSPKITNTSKASSSKCEDKTKSPKITNTSKATSSKCEDALSIGSRIARTYKRHGKEEMEEVIGFPLKKKEKKELIRRDLKTKFRRLGMLPIADLETKK